MSVLNGYFDKLHDRAGRVASKTAQWLDMHFEVEHVPAVVANKRFSTCKQCENLRSDGTCAICKCDMEFKTTLRHSPFDLRSTDKKQLVVCPIDKW